MARERSVSAVSCSCQKCIVPELAAECGEWEVVRVKYLCLQKIKVTHKINESVDIGSALVSVSYYPMLHIPSCSLLPLFTPVAVSCS